MTTEILTDSLAIDALIWLGRRGEGAPDPVTATVAGRVLRSSSSPGGESTLHVEHLG